MSWDVRRYHGTENSSSLQPLIHIPVSLTSLKRFCFVLNVRKSFFTIPALAGNRGAFPRLERPPHETAGTGRTWEGFPLVRRSPGSRLVGNVFRMAILYLTRVSNQRRYWIRVCFLYIFLLYNRRGFSHDFGCDARAQLLLPNSLIEHTFVN